MNGAGIANCCTDVDSTKDGMSGALHYYQLHCIDVRIQRPKRPKRPLPDVEQLRTYRWFTMEEAERMVSARRASAEPTPTQPGPALRSTDRRLQELYDLHGAVIFRYLLRWTLGERQIAEDLVQETMLRAWKNLAHLDSDLSTVRPWLFTVARRIAVDALRAKRARPAEIGDEDLHNKSGGEDEIERMLDAVLIRRAMMRLSSDHRRVLVEIYYRGRSVGEAAAILDIPEGTVKSRSHYALRALQTAIQVEHPLRWP